jgi:hypothetical protein
VQGWTAVGEEEPGGHRGLQAAVVVAGASVEVPGGQVVHAREEEEEL